MPLKVSFSTSKTMNKLPQSVKDVQCQLDELADKRNFIQARKVVLSVIRLLDGSISNDNEGLFELFTDSDGKIRSNSSWFYEDPVIADRKATYKVYSQNQLNIDFKLYGIVKPGKRTISWAQALTPNFEDEPFNSKFNVGIDFVVPKSADRVIVVLSSGYVVRTLELKGQLTATFQEILSKWTGIKNFDNKREVHTILWESFDLRPLNKKFYAGISERFILLRQHLVNEKIIDEKHAPFFSNRLIGRIIFCWFLDKKGIINPDVKYFNVRSCDSSTDYYRKKLETLFYKILNTPISDRCADDDVTPYLNGGLFEARETDLFENQKLTFPKNYFADLFEFLSSYNFTTDESTSQFQQVAIDPEMLGRIFENLLAEMVDETGEQARKAKGAFYTPREIVDYMCRESLREYLKTKIPEDPFRDQRLKQLLDAPDKDFQDQDHNWRRDWKPYKDGIIKALDELKVIDPACGSGAFPIGMMQLLCRVYERLEARFDSYKTKLQIIEKNIYGVDIEPMAVEIARLRAWLSIIVDEESNSGNIKPLPNLEFKFICANSLIDLDKNDEETFGDDPGLADKLQSVRDAYFGTDSLVKKRKLRHDYEQLINVGESLFGESIRSKQLKSYKPFDNEWSSSFFNPEFMFGVKSFNVVIANPPYIGESGHKDLFRKTKEGALGHFYIGKMDYFYFFFHLALNLVSACGEVAFITTNYYLTATGARKLRADFKQRATIRRFVNFNELTIFETAQGQHNMITLLTKGKASENAHTCIVNRTGSVSSDILGSILRWNDEASQYYEVTQGELYDGVENYIRLNREKVAKGKHKTTINMVLDKVADQGEVLGKIASINQGVVSGCDYVSTRNTDRLSQRTDTIHRDGIFVFDLDNPRDKHVVEGFSNSEKQLLRKFYKNSDVSRYSCSALTSKRLLYIGREFDNLNDYPNVFEHLKKFRAILSERREVANGRIKFFQLQWPRSEYIFTGEKIVVPYRSEENVFGYSTTEWFCRSDCYIIMQKDPTYALGYLLALLNSTLYFQWLFNRGKRKGKMLELFQVPLSEIPIKHVSAVEQGRFVELTGRIIELKNKNAIADTSALEVEIDHRVYELYGLTNEEIEIVENLGSELNVVPT